MSCSITRRKIIANEPKQQALIEFGYPNLRTEEIMQNLRKSINNDGYFRDPLTHKKSKVDSSKYRWFMKFENPNLKTSASKRSKVTRLTIEQLTYEQVNKYFQRKLNKENN